MDIHNDNTTITIYNVIGDFEKHDICMSQMARGVIWIKVQIVSCGQDHHTWKISPV